MTARLDATGEYRLWLDDVDEDTTATFVAAVDELLGVLGTPSHVVAEHVPAPPDRGEGWKVLFGRARPVARTWFAVPAVLCRSQAKRDAFEAAWGRWISASSVVGAETPVGVAALLGARGSSPVRLTAVVRAAWS